jgi:hypothetical protein
VHHYQDLQLTPHETASERKMIESLARLSLLAATAKEDPIKMPKLERTCIVSTIIGGLKMFMEHSSVGSVCRIAEYLKIDPEKHSYKQVAKCIRQEVLRVANLACSHHLIYIFVTEFLHLEINKWY